MDIVNQKNGSFIKDSFRRRGINSDKLDNILNPLAMTGPSQISIEVIKFVLLRKKR